MPTPPRTTSIRPTVWLTAGHVWAIFGLALSSALLGFAWIGTAMGLRRKGDWSKLRECWRGSSDLLAPLAIYLVAFGISAATSIDPRHGFREFFSAVFTVSAVPLLLVWVKGERLVRWVLQGVVITIGVCGLWGIAQYLFTAYGPVANRIPGPFSHYMTYSGVLMVGALILLARLGVRRDQRTPLNWSLLALVNVAMILTLTRHVWIATVVAIVIVVWTVARRWTPHFAVALVLVGLLLSACAPDQWSRVRSIGDLDDASNYDRLCMTWSGLKMIQDRPIFGHGPSSVETSYPIYRHPTAPRVHVRHLHNTFVNMAAERGLIELCAFLWLLWVVAREGHRGYRRFRDQPEGPADLYFTVFLAVVVFSLAGLFEANWRDTEVSRLMLFLMTIPWLLRETPDGDRAGSATTTDELSA